MASGKPDWNRIVTVQGKDGDNWIPIKVDATGQMFIAMTGQEIDVTQIDSDRNIMGDKDGEKKYIAVDSDGVILSRMKGRYGPDLKDIIVDISGMMLARMKGNFYGALKDIQVDTNGRMVCKMIGTDSGTPRALYVDADGKMVARIQGATGGDLVVFVLDDCGDTDLISNWSNAEDGLAPVESTTFVREGSKSMKLGIDASLFGTDVATWMNSVTIGDLTGLNTDTVKIWVYINTLDYLLAAGTCFHFRIGSGGADYIGFNFTKANLTVGWNEIDCDLSSPDMTFGAIDWSAINTQLFEVTAVDTNLNDFYIVVDSIVVVRTFVGPSTMKDLNTDENGFLLARMVGSFGDYRKPIQTDRFGNLRVNPTQTDKKPIVSLDHNQTMKGEYTSRVHPATEDYELKSITGPGVILGGMLYHGGTGAHTACIPYVVVDGVTFPQTTLLDLNARAADQPELHIPFLTKYDTTAHRYGVGFPRGLYFQDSFAIKFDENVGAATTHLYVYYALL